jgi:hypothetical protein
LLSSQLSAEVVIPSYNRLPILRDNIRLIRRLYPDLPVCLALQGEMPDSAMQSELGADKGLRLEKMPFPSSTRALNRCIASSKADVVLILDDDAVPCFGWLESHMAAFEKDQGLAYTAGREVRLNMTIPAYSAWVRIIVEALFGLLLAKDKKIRGRIVSWFNWLGLFFGNFDMPGTCLVNSARGCNMAVRKSEFVKVNGFNQELRGNSYLFEVDFGLRLAKQGKLGRYLGDAVVIHREVPSGGCRLPDKIQWFKDYLHNHTFIIRILGPQAWIGSLPRLIKRRFFV